MVANNSAMPFFLTGQMKDDIVCSRHFEKNICLEQIKPDVRLSAADSS